MTLSFLGIGQNIGSSFQSTVGVSVNGFNLITDDLLIAVVSNLGPPAPSPTVGAGIISGWNTLLSDSYVATITTEYVVFWKLRTDGETEQSATFDIHHEPSVVQVMAWRGVNTSLPIADSAHQTNVHGSSTAIDAPSVTAAVDASVFLSFFSWSHAGVFSGTFGITPPSGMTELDEGNASAWMTLESCDVFVNTGATGAKTATADQAHTQCAGISLIINPVPESNPDSGSSERNSVPGRFRRMNWYS